MLQIAHIPDAYLIEGYVLDSPDFPDVGHAWIQIGEDFYDPSFELQFRDDSDDYLYYKIPYDIFYTNRYNTFYLPQELFTTPKEDITDEISRRRLALTSRYRETDDYMVLKPAFLRKHFQIPAETDLTL